MAQKDIDIWTESHCYKIVTEQCNGPEEGRFTHMHVERVGIDLDICLFSTDIEVCAAYTDIIAQHGVEMPDGCFELKQGDEIWKGRLSRIATVLLRHRSNFSHSAGTRTPCPLPQ